MYYVLFIILNLPTLLCIVQMCLRKQVIECR